MSIADDLDAAEGEAAAAEQVAHTPKGWNPQRTENEDGSGEIVTRPYPGTLDLPTNEEILRDHNLDPEVYEIVGAKRVSQWPGGKGGTDVVAFRFSYDKIGARENPNHLDLPVFYSIRDREPEFVPSALPQTHEHVAIVATADWQVGKVGRRGGTPELYKRIRRMRQTALEALDADKPDMIVYMDGADALEGFESGGNPMFTNDLSLPDQIDFYSTETRANLIEFAQIAPVVGMTAPGNHTVWRAQKQRLGSPTR